MHEYTDEIEQLANKIVTAARERTRLDPIPLDHPRTEAELREACGQTITAKGIGGDRALELYTETLAPASLSPDFPRYLSFVPAAPTETAILFDLMVGASSIYGGSWIEGAGAVFAENEALDWIRRLCELPEGSGGVFVPGGTIGNLSAMVAARHDASLKAGDNRPARWAFLASAQSHSSIESATQVMDCDVITSPVDDDFRMTGEGVAAALAEHGDRICGVVATAGTTNLGRIDHLADIGAICREHNVWFHVDAAYGGAGMAAPKARPLFDGIEHADSVIIDPHKWLFAPFDCCALLYRDPDKARAVHAQHAGYLSFLDRYGDWNPSDFAIHLTRRIRGLPFWFSLATHGSDAYGDAVQVTIDLAEEAARQIRACEHLELVVEPSLSVVAFQRIGWDADQYSKRTEEMMEAGSAFVVPSRHEGEPVYRFCFVNPKTTHDDIAAIIELLK
ncbi:MAG: aminotransferase class I/II-fold pyridoxal phosphate-dependent enzyme [Acidimicrobiales bacterium]